MNTTLSLSLVLTSSFISLICRAYSANTSGSGTEALEIASSEGAKEEGEEEPSAASDDVEDEV